MKKNINYSLCLVTDRQLCGQRSLESVVELAVQGGVTLVQLREKNLIETELLRIGERLKKLLDFYSIPLIINDYVAVAKKLDAAGVHIGQKDMDYLQARKILGTKKIIGLSVTTLAEAEKAQSYDVDYLGVGPIFPTTTKLDASEPWGIKKLKLVRKFSRHKLMAIGGIQLANIAEVMQTGVDGVAVVSAICAAEYPKNAAMKLLKSGWRVGEGVIVRSILMRCGNLENDTKCHVSEGWHPGNY